MTSKATKFQIFKILSSIAEVLYVDREWHGKANSCVRFVTKWI
jgi:hypothetical protein